MEKKLLQYLQRKIYMNFPIYETNENEIISIKGDASYFYQITTPDLSQLTDIETESLYGIIESEMRNFKEEYFYKIYYLSDNLYLNTNDPVPTLTSLRLTPENNPLKPWFGVVENFEDVELFDEYFRRPILPITKFL